MLKRKMLRDVWKNKVPFIAVFLMMFAGNFIFSGITSEYHGFSHDFQTFIHQTHMADAWVSGSKYEEKDAEKLEAAEGITKAEKRMLIPARVEGVQEQSVDLYVLDDCNEISSMLVAEGEAYGPKKKGLWLDVTFAEENHLRTGDKITLTCNGMKIEESITGLCYSPEYIYAVSENEMVPDHKRNGFAFLNQSAFAYPDLIQWNQIVAEGSGDLQQILQEILGIEGNSFLLQKDHPSYSMPQGEITQHKEIGLIFVAAFLFIALLVTITTVHRLLKSQRLQIGIMKAMGFRKRQLYGHYISHSTFVCLCGSVIGWLTGSQVLPALILPFMKTMYTLPKLEMRMLPGSWLLPVFCTIACLLLSFLVCRNYLRENAAAILYTNAARQSYRELPLKKLRSRLNFYSQWNIRDIARNKLRSVMTVFGVVGCVALLYSACSLYTSMVHLTDWTFHQIQTYEVKVTGDFSENAFKEELLTQMRGQELMESSIEIWADDEHIASSFTGIEDQKYIHLMKNDREEITLDEGVALSENIGEEYKIKAGDIIRWRFYGEKDWRKSQVSALIRTPLSQGITMRRKTMEEENIEFQSTAIIGREPKGDILQADAEENTIGRSDHQNGRIENVQYREDFVSGLDEMMEGMVMMCSIFLSAAILLGGVILYNLGTLTFMERYREMATLKVLGFPNGRIRRLMVQQNAWLTGIGILIGLPAGYALVIVMLGTVQSSMDINVFAPWYVYGLSMMGTFLLSWLISRMLSRNVKKIDMVSALKINE